MNRKEHNSAKITKYSCISIYWILMILTVILFFSDPLKIEIYQKEEEIEQNDDGHIHGADTHTHDDDKSNDEIEEKSLDEIQEEPLPYEPQGFSEEEAV
jgi:hypothetical protein